MITRGVDDDLSGWRRRFRSLTVGLLVAAGILILLEGAARLLPVDRWERDRPNLSYPLFLPGEGPEADRYVTNLHFRGAMDRQSFARIKPSGGKRIFVVGGSAALGWPGPEASSFAGYLRRALEKAAPGRYEIINVAAMSYGSHRVLDLLHDIADLEPDAVIVWSGNNEYIERNLLPPRARSRAMSGVQRVLRHSHLYRSIRLAVQTVAPGLFARPATGDDLTDPRFTPQVRRGRMGRSGELDRQVFDNYRDNLRRMAELVSNSGARGIYCTVPVNLSGWAPANIVPEIAEATRRVQRDELREQAFSLWDRQAYAAAIPLLRQLTGLSADYALAHYLLGKGEQLAGRPQAALVEFNLARDLDPRPLRALSSFSAAVREVAAREGARLVDLEQGFVRESSGDLSGAGLFLDYVHPSERGAKLAAIAVARELTLGDDPSLAERVARLIGDDDWQARNFDWAADYYYALGMTFQNNGDFGRAEEAYLRVLAADPAMPEAAGNLGHIAERRGDLETARHYYRQAVNIDPGTVVAADLARVLYLLGDPAGARELGERLLKGGLVDVDLLVLLGDVERAAGRQAAAGEYYRQALAAGADEQALRARLAAGGHKP